MGRTRGNGVFCFAAEDTVGGVEPSVEIVIERQPAHRAGENFGILYRMGAGKQEVQMVERFVPIAFAQQQETEMGQPEQGEGFLSGKFG